MESAGIRSAKFTLGQSPPYRFRCLVLSSYLTFQLRSIRNVKRKIIVFDSSDVRNVWFVLSAARPARIRKTTQSLVCVFLLLSNLVLPDPSTVSSAEKIGQDEQFAR